MVFGKCQDKRVKKEYKRHISVRKHDIYFILFTIFPYAVCGMELSSRPVFHRDIKLQQWSDRMTDF